VQTQHSGDRQAGGIACSRSRISRRHDACNCKQAGKGQPNYELGARAGYKQKLSGRCNPLRRPAWQQSAALHVAAQRMEPAATPVRIEHGRTAPCTLLTGASVQAVRALCIVGRVPLPGRWE